MSFTGDFFLTAELAASERLMILLVGITFHATQEMLPAKNIMSKFIPKITYRFWAGCQCQSAVCVDRSGRLMATDNSQTSHQDYKKLLTNGSSERFPHECKLPWEFFPYLLALCVWWTCHTEGNKHIEAAMKWLTFLDDIFNRIYLIWKILNFL